MKIYRDIMNVNFPVTAVTLGKFDGVHQGHRKLIQSIMSHKNADSVVFTFDIMPESVIEQKNLIYSREEKEFIVNEINPDIYVTYPFGKKESEMSPYDFVKSVLVDRLHAGYIAVGTDFHFGFRGAGDCSYLEKLKKEFGYELEIVEKLKFNNEEISSSRIRSCIQNRDFVQANKMLQSPYFIMIDSTEQIDKKLYRFAWPEKKYVLPEGEYNCMIPDTGIKCILRIQNEEYILHVLSEDDYADSIPAEKFRITIL